jgi:hypothetical protein
LELLFLSLDSTLLLLDPTLLLLDPTLLLLDPTLLFLDPTLLFLDPTLLGLEPPGDLLVDFFEHPPPLLLHELGQFHLEIPCSFVFRLALEVDVPPE